MSRGRVHEDASLLDGFVVESDGRPVGCALWHEVDGDAELVVIVTTYRGAGAGTALLDAVVDYARANEWKRLWLITTNDNTDALRLYQRAGWDWVAWHRDARHATPGRSSPSSPRPAPTTSRSATRSSSSTRSDEGGCRAENQYWRKYGFSGLRTFSRG